MKEFTGYQLSYHQVWIGQWMPISTAPKDVEIFIIAADLKGDLPPMVTTCTWDESGGFHVDEFREPVLWRTIL